MRRRGSSLPGGCPRWERGKVVGDLYRVEKFLGRGDFGVVYLAREIFTRRPVAIKVPVVYSFISADGELRRIRFSDSSVAKERLFAEVRAWMSLCHPHVVEAVDVRDDKSTDHVPAICLEYCNGGSLSEGLKGTGEGLPIPEGIDTALQVCWALSYIHSQGILHRDLKSANVLLMNEEAAKGRLRALISDLGLAKVLHSYESAGPGFCAASGRATLSHVMGTPTHMAPELWEEGASVGPEADVYAFGVLLYESFCGRVPFAPGHLFLGIEELHRHGPRPDPRRWRPKLPRDLCGLMMRCLAPRPEDRPTLTEAEAVSVEVFRQTTGESYGQIRRKPSQQELSVELCRRRGWARLRMGVGAGRRGDYGEAEREFSAAEMLFRQATDERGMGAARGNRAVVLGCTGNLPQALVLLKAVTGLWQKLGDPSNLGRSLVNRALLYIKMSRPQAAVSCLRRARRALRQAGDWTALAVSITTLASLYVSQREKERAERIFPGQLPLPDEFVNGTCLAGSTVTKRQ
ncbi:MAG: serine/threonine protein kinase [Thermoguttaceae bacterium]|nr:serine/threonine protein kinase [Thermoguttaceae bacterium]MDW8079203.1 serine/threonine-protein kinase [Thermoguttaceae bacterium]